jgi:hypothetical protein
MSIERCDPQMTDEYEDWDCVDDAFTLLDDDDDGWSFVGKEFDPEAPPIWAAWAMRLPPGSTVLSVLRGWEQRVVAASSPLETSTCPARSRASRRSNTEPSTWRPELPTADRNRAALVRGAEGSPTPMTVEHTANNTRKTSRFEAKLRPVIAALADLLLADLLKYPAACEEKK